MFNITIFIPQAAIRIFIHGERIATDPPWRRATGGYLRSIHRTMTSTPVSPKFRADRERQDIHDLEDDEEQAGSRVLMKVRSPILPNQEEIEDHAHALTLP